MKLSSSDDNKNLALSPAVAAPLQQSAANVRTIVWTTPIRLICAVWCELLLVNYLQVQTLNANLNYGATVLFKRT